jgi:hypothetical protein
MITIAMKVYMDLEVALHVKEKTKEEKEKYRGREERGT